MTWQSTGDLMQHVRVLNGNTRGCQDCGTVMEYQTDSGFTAYYPGVECCQPAIRRQIRWRSEEIDALNRKLRERQDAVARIREEVELAPSRSALAAAETKLSRAEKNLHLVVRDHFTPALRELSDEIARLKRKYAQLPVDGAPEVVS